MRFATPSYLAWSYSGSWRQIMKTVKILFFCHLAALLFGLGGMLIALPHPELWANNAFGVEVFNFGIRYAGSPHSLRRGDHAAVRPAIRRQAQDAHLLCGGDVDSALHGIARHQHRLSFRAILLYQFPGLQDSGPCSLFHSALLVLHGFHLVYPGERNHR